MCNEKFGLRVTAVQRPSIDEGYMLKNYPPPKASVGLGCSANLPRSGGAQ